jgi:hypothetical protein
MIPENAAAAAAAALAGEIIIQTEETTGVTM